MATRFYLPNGIAVGITPAFNASFTTATQATRHRMTLGNGYTALANGTAISVGTGANQSALDRQYISDPITAQTLSPGGIWTFKGQLLVKEALNSNNIDRVTCSLRVFSNDGTTLRGTLAAFASFRAANEYALTLTNRMIADGDGLSQVVALDGDVIVLDVGHRQSATGGAGTPTATAQWGDIGTDLPENETATSGIPWLELSGNVTFQTAALPRSVLSFPNNPMGRMNYGGLRVPPTWIPT